MASIRDIPFGSTVKTLRGLTSFLDSQREGDYHPFENHRVLDAYYDRGVFNDHEGWYTVCLENSDGGRFWVQVPDQQVDVEPGGLDLAIGTLPPVPKAGLAYVSDLRPGDRIEHDGIEGTIVAAVPDADIDGDGDPVPVVDLTVETRTWSEARWTLSIDEQVRVEASGLHRGGNLHSLRQVPVGSTVRLRVAHEPVRQRDFPAPSHMREGTIREMKPATPDYRTMLVYLANADGEGWLKVPSSQGVRIIETAPGPVPPAPWEASEPAPEADGPATAPLAAMAPGTVVSGLTVYPLDAVTGLTENHARVLNNALIQDLKPLGVDVDGKAMMLLAVEVHAQELLVIAERDGILIHEFEVPGRAKPSSALLQQITPDDLLQSAHNAPILAHGLNQHGEPAAFYGNLYNIQPEAAGLTLLPSQGRITPGSQWLTNVPKEALWQFRDTATDHRLVPAPYLRQGQVIINDDGAKAAVLSANQSHNMQRIVVQTEDGRSALIEAPAEKLFRLGETPAEVPAKDTEYAHEATIEAEHLGIPVESADTFFQAHSSEVSTI